MAIVIKRILAPTDFSELSRAGMQYALEMAEQEEAEVIAFHVDDHIPSGDLKGRGGDAIEKFIQGRKKDLDEFLIKNFSYFLTKVGILKEVDIGVAYEKIIEKAGKEKVDMIVLSTHGRTGLSHALIGSTTEQVVRRAPCPVLSIHPKSNL